MESIFLGNPIGVIILSGFNYKWFELRDFIYNFKKNNVSNKIYNTFNRHPMTVYFVVNEEGYLRLQSLCIAMAGSYNGKKVFFKINAKPSEQKFFFLESKKDEKFYKLSQLESKKILGSLKKTLNIQDKEEEELINNNVREFQRRFCDEKTVHFDEIRPNYEICEFDNCWIDPRAGKIRCIDNDRLRTVKQIKSEFLSYLDYPYIPGRESTMIWFEKIIGGLVKRLFELWGIKKLSSNSDYRKATRDLHFFLKLIEKGIYLAKKENDSLATSNGKGD